MVDIKYPRKRRSFSVPAGIILSEEIVAQVRKVIALEGDEHRAANVFDVNTVTLCRALARLPVRRATALHLTEVLRTYDRPNF